MSKTTTEFPDFIKNFAKVKFPPQVKGNSTFLGNSTGQVVFHNIAMGMGVPPHTHDNSWAIIVSGEMECLLGDKKFIANTGDSWFIPADVPHGGTALKDSLMVEVFCEERWTAME